jgi:DNA sulfur modification protein DndD
MKIIETFITNFMPYKGTHRIKFPGDAKGNVMLVFGDNMRGKTSFLNAIRFAFYGSIKDRNLAKVPLLEAINSEARREGNWEMSVRMTFEHLGACYDLRRTVRKKTNIFIPKKDSDFEETVDLKKNDEPLPQLNINHEINQIIPEDVSRFFLFDGELLQEYEELLQDYGENGDIIKEAIEKVLGVPALVHGREDASVLLNVARKNQVKTLNNIQELKRLAQDQHDYSTSYDRHCSDLEDLKARKEHYQCQIAECDRFLEEKDKALKHASKVERVKEEVKQVEQRQEELLVQQQDGLTEAWRDLLQPRLRGVLGEVENRVQDIQRNQDALAVINEDIRRLEVLLGGAPCETCGESIATDRREILLEKLRGLREILGGSQSELAAFSVLSGKASQLRALIGNFSLRRVLDAEKERLNLRAKAVRLDNELNQLREESPEADWAEMTKISKRKEHAAVESGRLDRDIDELRKKIQDLEDKQKQLQKLLNQNRQARGERTTRLVNLYQLLQNIFTGGIDELRDTLRKRVQEYATTTFKKLTTDKTYQGLSINSNYGLRIVDKNGEEVRQRSAGAEQVVALALIDALNRTSRASGPIIMDTPLGRLDLKHRENVLTYVPEMAEQVVLLVHEGEIGRNQENIPLGLKERIGCAYEIKGLSSSESRIVELKG